MASQALRETKLPGVPFLRRGKVRDLYDLGDSLLLVATDRVSAFDVVLPDPIPLKGKVLTTLSAFWFQHLSDILPNHLVTVDVGRMPALLQPHRAVLEGRSMFVRRTEPLPIECIVRGYLAGSAWDEYERQGTVGGQAAPAGLRFLSALPEPLFTPTTKAETGHDRPVSFAEVGRIVGEGLAEQVRRLSLALFQKAQRHAAASGMIICDTKFEFGLRNGELLLIDEVLTPDSSRYWPREFYESGKGGAFYDKQIIRDYLVHLQWDQKPPAPPLPEDVIVKTSLRYVEVCEKITGVRIA